MRYIILFIIFLLACASMHAQNPLFKQTLEVSIAEPVILDVAVSRGDITIGYARDGEVSIYASAKDLAGKNVMDEFFKTGLLIEQNKNRISIRDSLVIVAGVTTSISYRIDVPFPTQINS